MMRLGGCDEVGGKSMSVLASSLRASTHDPQHGESAGSSGRRHDCSSLQ